MKNNHFLFGILFLIFLSVNFPDGIPFFIFLGILLFVFSETGKNLFDLEKWEKQIEQYKDKEKIIIQKKTKEKDNTPENFFTLNNMTPKNSGINPPLFIVGIIGFIIFSIISDGIVSIPAGSTGVIFDKLSNEVKQETLPAGINFKLPFFQQVIIVNTRMQEYTINSKRDPIEALTKDGQKVNVEVTVQYFIKKKNAPKLFEEQGMDYESKIIKAGVRSIVREVITGYDSTKLYNQEFRKKAQDEIKEKLYKNFEKKYIHLEDVLMRDVKFSGKYLEAIEQEQVAKVNIKKAENINKEAEIIAKTTIIKAKAEAEALRLKGEALSKSPEIVQLQFVEKMAPNIHWGVLPDGAIPMINTENLQNK